MTELVIPWPAGPAWRQSVALDGRVYRLSASWNEVGDHWTLSIASRDAEPLVQGICLTAGALHIARHADTRLPRGWFVTAPALDCGCKPGRYDMGVNAELIYVSPI